MLRHPERIQIIQPGLSGQFRLSLSKSGLFVVRLRYICKLEWWNSLWMVGEGTFRRLTTPSYSLSSIELKLTMNIGQRVTSV